MVVHGQQQQQHDTVIADSAFASRATALLALGYQLKPPQPHVPVTPQRQPQVPPEQAPREEASASTDGDGRRRGGDGSSTRTAASESGKMEPTTVVAAPSPDECAWWSMFSRLVHYRATYGHCDVPADAMLGIENDRILELGRWVRQQREEYVVLVGMDDDEARPCSLTHERIRLLEEQGLRWNAYGRSLKPRRVADDERWNDMFFRLVQYRAAHGHCDVPKRLKGGSGNDDVVRLGRWVSRQRRLYRISAMEGRPWRYPLTPKRIRLLEEQGFNWCLKKQRSPCGRALGRATMGRAHGGGSGKPERLVPRPKPSKPTPPRRSTEVAEVSLGASADGRIEVVAPLGDSVVGTMTTTGGGCPEVSAPSVWSPRRVDCVDDVSDNLALPPPPMCDGEGSSILAVRSKPIDGDGAVAGLRSATPQCGRGQMSWSGLLAQTLAPMFRLVPLLRKGRYDREGGGGIDAV